MVRVNVCRGYKGVTTYMLHAKSNAKVRNEMTGALGQDSALVRLYWAGDKPGLMRWIWLWIMPLELQKLETYKASDNGDHIVTDRMNAWKLFIKLNWSRNSGFYVMLLLFWHTNQEFMVKRVGVWMVVFDTCRWVQMRKCLHDWAVFCNVWQGITLKTCCSLHFHIN